MSTAGSGQTFLGGSSTRAAQGAHSESRASALEGGSASNDVLADITTMVEPQPQVAATLVRVAPPAAATTDEPLRSVFESDSQDPQRANEYADDIFDLLLTKESHFLLEPDYMEVQADINAHLRARLIDWLVSVHSWCRLRPKTLFLTVNIIDRYLSAQEVTWERLQLIGIVAVFIAAKCEEVMPPPKARDLACDLAYMTCHAYSKTEIVTMELNVLVTLKFEIAAPTPVDFLARLQRANGCDVGQRLLVHYILELSLLDVRNVRFPPSLLVSAALLVINESLGRRPTWPAAMAHLSCYSESSLQACAAGLRVRLHEARTTPFQASRRKYQLALEACLPSNCTVGRGQVLS